MFAIFSINRGARVGARIRTCQDSTSNQKEEVAEKIKGYSAIVGIAQGIVLDANRPNRPVHLRPTLFVLTDLFCLATLG